MRGRLKGSIHSALKRRGDIVRLRAKGLGMRSFMIGTVGIFGAAVSAAPASAATMVVYADPMTFETRRVVVNPTGPDRTFFCLLPPSQVGCHEVKRAKR